MQRENLISSILKNSDDYIFFADMDNLACYTDKKHYIQLRTASNVDAAKIIIVKTEIESWYLAGLNYHDARSLNIVFHTNTDNITKEMFQQMTPNSFPSAINLMTEILKKFSMDVCKEAKSIISIFLQ